jgi:hypothetical protein
MTGNRPPKRATLNWPGTRRDRRRAVLLPLGAAVLVGGTLTLLSIGDDDGADEEASTEAQKEIAALEAGQTESLEDKRNGIALRFPRTWRRSNRRGEHVLESRDRCMAIKLSAPVAAARAGRLRRDTLAALRRGFRRIQIAPGEQGKQIGGIPTTQDVITIQTKQGGQTRVLLAVGRGKNLAYLTESVLRDPACNRTLLEGQLILNSARFSR